MSGAPWAAPCTASAGSCEPVRGGAEQIAGGLREAAAPTPVRDRAGGATASTETGAPYDLDTDGWVGVRFGAVEQAGEQRGAARPRCAQHVERGGADSRFRHGPGGGERVAPPLTPGR